MTSWATHCLTQLQEDIFLCRELHAAWILSGMLLNAGEPVLVSYSPSEGSSAL